MIEYLSSGLNFNVLVTAINVKCQRAFEEIIFCMNMKAKGKWKKNFWNSLLTSSPYQYLILFLWFKLLFAFSFVVLWRDTKTILKKKNSKDFYFLSMKQYLDWLKPIEIDFSLVLICYVFYLSSGLWLVKTDHMTWLLASDWSILASDW